MREKIKNVSPYAVIALGAVILFIKCFYSFCWSDETFYFATCHRFFTGDSVFLHEWFPTQLSSVVLLPFYSIYMLICGSNTGIFLYFRILYVIMSTFNAVVMYNIIRQHSGRFSGLVCSLLLMYYTHLNIATLSYYTLSVQLYLMSMLLIYHYYKSRSKKQLIISGILFAISVLCLPTLSIVYFITTAVLGIFILCDKHSKTDSGSTTVSDKAQLPVILRYTFIGILIPAVLFFIFLFLNVSVSDFIKGIPYVLSDEEHGTSLIYPLRKFFISINEVFGTGAYASYLLITVSFISMFINRLKNRTACMIMFLADIVLFAINFICSNGHTGYIQTVFCLFAIPLFFVTRRKDMRLFFLFIVSGMVFSLVYSYSSNGYLYVLSMGHFIASIGCVLITEQFVRELLADPDKSPDIADSNDTVHKTGRKLITWFSCNFPQISLIACTAVICAVLVQTMMLRLVNIYRDAPPQMLKFRITAGPASGLYTTADHHVAYNVVYSTIKKYCQSSNLNDPQKFPNSLEQESNSVANIFITKLLPWGYMCTDLRCASPTTWRTSFNSERLKPYYEMNPGRYPDMILVLDEQFGSYLTCGDVESDPIPNENEIGGYLLEYVNSNSYEIINVPCGILYKRL
ncbi:MAG: hypothetical protein IKP31_01390 [Lachnospiraceae bacterium]|nr:hypothetical protein [Lachnospiraceae bacterium]